MKRTLGKKNCVQDGTLVAFASCSCDSMCSILGCDCSTGDTASNTLSQRQSQAHGHTNG